MGNTHSSRHTRRGIVRDGLLPKSSGLHVAARQNVARAARDSRHEQCASQNEACEMLPPAYDFAFVRARQARLPILKGLPELPLANPVVDWDELEFSSTPENDEVETFSFAPDAIDDWHQSSAYAQPNQPRVEVDSQGGRVEHFDDGSRIVKDRIGRPVEVCSAFGDTAFFEYDPHGKLAFFQRVDADGVLQNHGWSGPTGVVILDGGGRIFASGESMIVDPRARLSVHAQRGQFVMLDMLSCVQVERVHRPRDTDMRKVKYSTSILAQDGFRMATMLTVPAEAGDTIFGDQQAYVTCFRFYGRDGTVIDFTSEDELRELQPSRATSPATNAISATWRKHRQAATAWQSVHEYLTRVS